MENQDHPESVFPRKSDLLLCLFLLRKKRKESMLMQVDYPFLRRVVSTCPKNIRSRLKPPSKNKTGMFFIRNIPVLKFWWTACENP